MILYIRGENYRSIGERQTLSFVANSDKSHTNILIENNNINILPVIPLYGGNATGKTNILRLIKTVVELITGKTEIKEAYDPCKFYDKKESTFEIVFLENNIKYYYKISYTNESIVEEGLYYYPNGKISKIFDRKFSEFSFGNSFENELSKFSENLSISACFLYTISKFLGDKSLILNDVNKFFKEKFIFINLDKTTYTLKKAKEIFQKNIEDNNKVKEFIEYFYKHMNIGAKRIHYSIGIKIEQQEVLKKILNNKDLIEKILEKKSNDSKLEINEENLINSFSLDEDELYLVYDTPNKEIEISIEEESEGIKKIFTLGMPIADALCNNKFIVFDELEVGFHPLLSRKIIELFIPKHTKAQLLFTTHNTNLLDLDLFRRDQIYFTSRTKETSFKSVIKSLGEISGVRKSADIEKVYLEGKYSDAPVYNNFNNEEIGEILC